MKILANRCCSDSILSMLSLLPMCLLFISVVWAHEPRGNLENSNTNTLSFGVVPQQSASKLAQLWSPFIKEVADLSGLHIHFETAPSIPIFEQRLQDRRYDIAYMNPLHYAVFSRTAGYQVIASQSQKKLKGIIVVPVTSEISSVHDLQNTDIAFPAPLAFAATLIPQSLLKESNINFTAHYVNSHDSVYMNVAEGFFMAGGGVLRTFNEISPKMQNKLKILWISDGYMPHAFAVSPKLSNSDIKKLQRALLKMSNSKKTRALGFQGIQTASDKQYDDVRRLKESLNVISAH